MKCPKGHEHDKLSCPVCAEIKSHDIPMQRMLAAIKDGVQPVRSNRHWTLHADSWKKIAHEFNLKLVGAKFPVLCGDVEFSRRKISHADIDRVDDCAACDRKLDSLVSR